MYGKAILIIFVVLFLLYLWNKITEFVDNTDEIVFILYENMFHDQIHFSVATILTKNRIDNNINSGDSIQRKDDLPNAFSMMDIVNLSEYKALIYYPPENPPQPTDINPYFTYNSGEITIGNVIYSSSVLDTSPYYCKDNDNVTNRSIDNFYYFTYSSTTPQPKLFTTRLAILLKVNNQNQLKPDQDFSKHVSDSKVVKLGNINDDKYNILSLEENETDNDISRYLSGSTEDENIIMYIYEGLDIDEDEFPLIDETEEIDVFNKLMNIKCEDIYKSFGKRHNNPISTNTFDNYPNWIHNFIIKHINENIGDKNNSNKLLRLLIGKDIPSRTDNDWSITKEILASTKFKNHIEAMKINIVNFQNHIDMNSRDNILNYITLEITELDDINTLSPDDIRSLFVTLFTDSTTKNNNPVHQQLSLDGIDNIQELIFVFNFEDKTFVRLPYFLHICSQDSELIGILQTLIIKQDQNDNKMYISYTDVCRRNNDAQKFINSIPTNPDLSGQVMKRVGGETQAAMKNELHV